MAIIVDGNRIAGEIIEDLKAQIASLSFKPRLAVFLVGENPASLSYVKIKGRRAADSGINFDLRKYPADVSQDQLCRDIKNISGESDLCGILVQLPLPAHLDKQTVLDTIPSELDVDCLTTVCKQILAGDGEINFVPPAAAASLAILKYHNVNLANKNVVVVGAGDLIGKPLAHLLRRQGIAFSVIDINTPNPVEIMQKADVVISGAGKAGLVSGDKIKTGAAVIDAGTTGSEEGKIRGDVDFASVAKKASLVSPVPGGVGPVTVAMLLRNVVNAALRKNGVFS